MLFDGISILSSLQTKLAWLNDRQAVLSRNIANASTPGFMAQDLAPPDFSAALAEASRGGFFATSNPRHMRARTAAASESSRTVDAPDSQTSPDGNRVVVEEQMMRVAQTQMEYAEATGLYKKVFSLWRTALGGA